MTSSPGIIRKLYASVRLSWELSTWGNALLHLPAGLMVQVGCEMPILTQKASRVNRRCAIYCISATSRVRLGTSSLRKTA
jgi:hypothetical protein